MARRLREFYRPTNLDEAQSLLRRDDVTVRPLSIGPRPSALSDLDADAVADLDRLELNFVRMAEDAIHLGGATPLQDLVVSPVLAGQARGLLPEAARLTAPLSLRHLATVGGTLLLPSGPPELLLALLVLNATVVVRLGRNGETRDVPLATFMTQASSPPGDLVTVVKFPVVPAAGVGAAIQRVARTPRDQAIVAVAAYLEVAEGKCQRARIAVAGAGQRPQRLAAVEKMLEGQMLAGDRFQQAAEVVSAECSPLGDFRASADYRRATAGVLTRRALQAASTEVAH